jgi:hypothetical protein
MAIAPFGMATGILAKEQLAYWLTQGKLFELSLKIVTEPI